MKTTIYELLGMIKDDKAPKIIKFENRKWEWNDNLYDYCVIHEKENEADWYLFTDEMQKYYDGVQDYLNDEVEILDKIQEETPMFKKVDGEWYVNKDLVEWLDKNYEPIKFKNIDGIYIEKKNMIKKINIIEDLAEPTNENNIRFNFAEITDKINEIIDRLNKE